MIMISYTSFENFARIPQLLDVTSVVVLAVVCWYKMYEYYFRICYEYEIYYNVMAVNYN